MRTRHLTGFLTLSSLAVVLGCSGGARETAEHTTEQGLPISNGHAPHDGRFRPELTGVVSIVGMTGARSSTNCTGTLISPNMVITAAHCMVYGAGFSRGGDPSCWTERADGSIEGSTGCGVVEFTGVDGRVRDTINIRHVWTGWSNGDRSPASDIALVHLARKASPATAAQATPISLWYEGDPGSDYWKNARIEYAGWGKTDSIRDTCDGPDSASRSATELGVVEDKRLDGDAPVTSVAVTGMDLGGLMFVAHFDLYGDSTGFTLHGDSGGPLFAFDGFGPPRLVGVTHGFACEDYEVSGTLESQWARTFNPTNAALIKRVLLGTGADPDGDGIPTAGAGLNPWFPADVDNCPTVANPDQLDTNGNGIGDACDRPAGWHDGYPLSDVAVFVPGGGITAVARNQFVSDTYAIAKDGALWSAGGWANGLGFHTASRLGPTSRFTPGAPIAGLSRNEWITDLFTVGTDGAMYSAGSWVNGGGWTFNANPLTPAGILPPNAGLAAVNRTESVVDTFVIGKTGHLWAAWSWVNNVGYLGPREVVSTGATFRPGAGLAAVARNESVIDTFVVGEDGALWNAGSWVNGVGWAEPYPITAAGRYAPGAPVAAVRRTELVTDVYVIGADGAMWNAAQWVNGRDGWGTPYAVSPRGSLVPNGGLAADSRTQWNVDLYATSPKGTTLDVASWQNP